MLPRAVDRIDARRRPDLRPFDSISEPRTQGWGIAHEDADRRGRRRAGGQPDLRADRLGPALRPQDRRPRRHPDPGPARPGPGPGEQQAGAGRWGRDPGARRARRHEADDPPADRADRALHADPRERAVHGPGLHLQGARGPPAGPGPGPGAPELVQAARVHPPAAEVPRPEHDPGRPADRARLRQPRRCVVPRDRPDPGRGRRHGRRYEDRQGRRRPALPGQEDAPGLPRRPAPDVALAQRARA